MRLATHMRFVALFCFRLCGPNSFAETSADGAHTYYNPLWLYRMTVTHFYDRDEFGLHVVTLIVKTLHELFHTTTRKIMAVILDLGQRLNAQYTK